MLNIMKSEFYKVRKSKVTLVTFICLVAVVLINIIFGVYAKMAGGTVEKIMSDTKGIESYFTFGTGSFYLIFVALFVGGMVTNEYTNGTIRQVVSRGESRIQISIGQYVSLSTAMTVITLIPSIILGVFNSIMWQSGSISATKFIVSLFGQLVIIWSYAAISVLIAQITRSGGLAVGINIMFLIGGAIGTNILSVLTKKDFFSEYWVESMQMKAVDYIGQTVSKQLLNAVILCVLGIVCVVISTILFKKRDIN